MAFVVRPRITIKPGTIFDIMDQCLAVARKSHWPDSMVDEFRRMVYLSGSYDEAWYVICEYFDASYPGWPHDDDAKAKAVFG